MLLTSWIERIGQSWNRGSRRKDGRSERIACAGERLEERSLLTVSATFLLGELEIHMDTNDSVAVRENPVTPGTVQILANNLPLNSLGSISTSAVSRLLIHGGDEANLIDLSNMQVTAFSNPALSIEVDAGNGEDTLLGSGSLAASLNGGHGDDSIVGGGLNDTLLGDDGDDSIQAGGGNDSVNAGDGQDTVDGGSGDDSIWGGDGEDSIDGNTGNDNVTSDDGADTVNGGDGDDTLNGMAGADLIDGGNGNDSMLGGNGDDTLNGNVGNDSADGQSGVDSVLGGDGDDSLSGGAGNDSVSGEVGNDSLNGGSGDDIVDGGADNDSMLGGAGADAIFGSAGNDTIRGQAGNDTLSGGGGADNLNGDAGDDLVISGEPQVSIDDVIVTEGNSGVTSAVFTVSLSFASQQTITVDVSTTDGIATVANNDYVGLLNFPVVFAPGVTTQTVTVSVTGDTTIEADETFFVNLSNSVNATIFDGLGQGAILDDDNPGPDVSIGLNFTGSTVNNSGSIPPDTMGTVGLNHIVEMLNGSFSIYDKTTGAVLQRTSLDQFWISTGVAGPFGTFDSRIIFDPTVNRYFAISENRGPGPNNGGNSIFVAVSNTSDPTAGFSATRFVADSSGQIFNDYPTMAVDADGLYMATNNFGATTFDVSIYSIPKADLLLPTPSVANMTRFENLNAGQFGTAIQASLDFGASDGRAALLSVGNGNLIRTNILGATGPGATLSNPTPIAVPAFQPAPPADQPGGGPRIENVSPRFTGNVVEVGNSLWGTHTVLDVATGNSAIRWYEIDEVTNAVLQTGTITDPTMDYLDPSIAVNAAGVVVIGASGSGTGANEFASTYAFVGQTALGVTTFGSRMLLRAGTAPYFQDFGSGRNRWGDYSATVVDPTNPTVFWTFQEFANNATDWAIQITQLIVTPAAPPAPPPPPTISGAGDTLNGGDGNDTLLGSDGDDVISGNGGNDSLIGAGGNDSISGGSGLDLLDGGTGNDTLRGQGGKDTIIGGDGDDIFEWDATADGIDQVNNSSGSDQVSIFTSAANDTVTIGKLGTKLQVTSGGNQLTINPTIRIVNIDTGNGADTITVGDLNGVLPTVLTVNGGLGNDIINASSTVLGMVRMQLIGGDGDDSITGSISDDTIDGGNGKDTLLGGLGNDTIRGGADVDNINGGAGDDSIEGNDGNDSLVGGSGNDVMTGGLGNDLVSGNAGNDSLQGNEGRDTLHGGIENDVLDGGVGKDTLMGADGDDTLNGGRNDDVITGDAGNDVISGNHGNDTIDSGTGADTVNGNDGNDSINGGDGNDLIAGGNGNDNISGGNDDDLVTGGDGRDTIFGGGGNDGLMGDDGDDSLNGQGGTNTLAGGQGVDTLIGLPAEFDENFTIASDLLAILALL